MAAMVKGGSLAAQAAKLRACNELGGGCQGGKPSAMLLESMKLCSLL